MIRKVLSVFADFFAFIALFLSVFIAFHVFPSTQNLRFDYQAILIGIMAAIFTLLVGWNIYQMVDWKKTEKKTSELQRKLKGEIIYIHNKTDYNQAIMYALMCQSISSVFAPNEKDSLKYQMLLKGIQAMKMLSKMPDCGSEIEVLMNTMIKGLSNSESISLTDAVRTDLLVSCGEIENRDKIESWSLFIDLLKRA